MRNFWAWSGFLFVAVAFSNNPQITSRTTIRLFSSDNSNDDFMASLRTRVEQITENENQLPLIVLDTMLPRQILKITVHNELFLHLIRTRVAEENPTFGMLGMASLKTGQKVHLKTGVEVEILEQPEAVEKSLRVKLKAGRRFVVEGDVESTKQGWTEASVKFLDNDESDSEDPMSMAIAMQQAREFIEPNNTMNEDKSLVDMWLELARQNERLPGQIDQLLEDLGPCPSWERPSDCAFWVGALINPIPAMGVALEIRPALLTAKTAKERTQIALDGIWNSIQHMDGSRKFQQMKGK